MELIREYAALAMVCGAAMLLLPQSGLRRTASLAMGLVIALFWLSGLREMFQLPAVPVAPASLLETISSTGGR